MKKLMSSISFIIHFLQLSFSFFLEKKCNFLDVKMGQRRVIGKDGTWDFENQGEEEKVSKKNKMGADAGCLDGYTD